MSLATLTTPRITSDRLQVQGMLLVEEERREETVQHQIEDEEEEATRTLLDLLNTEKPDDDSTTTTTSTSTSTITITTSTSSRTASGNGIRRRVTTSSRWSRREQQPRRLWAILKRRLRLKGVACCGINNDAGPGPTSTSSSSLLPVDVDGDHQYHDHVADRNDAVQFLLPPAITAEHPQNTGENDAPPAPSETVGHGDQQVEAASTMNLGTALAAERQFRRQEEEDEQRSAALEPSRSSGVSGLSANVNANANANQAAEPAAPVSLMRLMAEAIDGWDEERGRMVTGVDNDHKVVGSDRVCCVCIERVKGAAMIPCGHTFCRVCSRELWINRGSCPLCNRPILEVLDIF